MPRRIAEAVAYTLFIALIVAAVFPLTACVGKKYSSPPSLNESDGWHLTLDTDFSAYGSIEEVYAETPWSPSPHGLRNIEYWCDQALSLDTERGVFVVSSVEEDDHGCDVCKAASGIFTGGIETRVTDSNDGFLQAFGYFEAVVKVPDAPGMWSAFWLQGNGTGIVGNGGKDSSEIDIYESSFHQKNRTKTGNAIHYDSYEAPWHRSAHKVTDVGYDLYDGEFHKYSLLWTPEYYVFYVDDFAVWKTSAGGVSRVPEYLRLTVEIRDTKYGPYRQKLGTFANASDGSTDFLIKSVKVWQNDAYTPYIQSLSDFKDHKPTYTALLSAGVTLSAAIVLAAATIFIVKRNRKKKTP